MSESPCQRPSAHARPPTQEAWGALPGLTPVQEYHALAQELRSCFPEATPRQLDGMIAHEMLCYGGHSRTVVMQTLLQASLSLAAEPRPEPEAYVQGALAEARQLRNDDAILGWGG
ncbi:MAG: hypothetical protein AB7N91_17680 [Candidatus Tectimicrobiota bacterium]